MWYFEEKMHFTKMQCKINNFMWYFEKKKYIKKKRQALMLKLNKNDEMNL